MSFLSENVDEILALSVVIPTIIVIGYQAMNAQEITMPMEPAMLILGFIFGKKIVLNRT